MNEQVFKFATKVISSVVRKFGWSETTPDFRKIILYLKNLSDDPEIVEQFLMQISADKNALKHPVDGVSVKNELQILAAEINNSLKLNEKIQLLMVILDCLLRQVDISEISEYNNYLLDQIGLDVNLTDRFSRFLTEDDPESFEGPDYMIFYPHNLYREEELEGKWIEGNISNKKNQANRFELEHYDRYILVLFIDQIKSFAVRCFSDKEKSGDPSVLPDCRFKLIGPGSFIKLNEKTTLSYAKLKNHFSQLHPKGVLSLNINAIHYKSVQGTKEIQSFTTQEKSGRLIGIIGREGVGKTTLLKLIAGQIKPGKGHISINGYDLWRYNYLLKGIIGYVPENDLLHDELTVYENLILTARLFYSNIGKHEIENRIEKLLEKLELSELKNVVVGNMYSKHVQPGQRRILNIALELIREPQLLIVDNAVSGLGMADASKVIKILHDYSYEGNLVITTISQVGSSSFRYFDKVWILDTQGHAVYNGTTYDCTTYLHKHLNLAYQKQENPDPSQLLDLVYYSVPDASGKILKRVLSPEQWQKIFNNEHAKSQQPKPDKGLLPARILKIPNLEVQLFIFSLRNFKCKFSRIRNIVSGLLAGPLIAGALAILLRYKINGEYIFARNNNIALYQYLSVIIAMTLGLILSANEILKERNIFKKEEYLELSRFSYINSKILYLFPIIGLQTLLYVLTGNMILGIKDMFYAYWVVLFSSGCSGILLGLLLSASIRHIETIYEKIIPVVIAIQLILGGGIIPYNNLNLGGGKYSPVLGDLTVSRWGYEALAVEQYKDNRYQKYFFDMDKHISNASFNAFQLIPRMQELLTRCNTGLENKDSMKYYTGILKTELTKLAEDPDIFPFEYINELSQDASKNILTEASDYLTYLSMHFYEEYEKMVQKKNLLTEKLEDSLGVNALQKIKNDYNNDRLEKIVTAENLETEYDIYDREIVRKSGPIFQEPQSNYGRAVFFCPTKLFNGQYMDTIWFNISIIWMLSFIFYLLLLTDISKLIRRLFNREPL